MEKAVKNPGFPSADEVLGKILGPINSLSDTSLLQPITPESEKAEM